MTSIQLGSLSLPLAPLLFIAAWLLAQQVAAFAAGRDTHRDAAPASGPAGGGDAATREPRRAASGAVSTAGILGLVVARAAYVIANLDVYRDTPLAIVDFRDGGWAPWFGVAAGLAWLAWAAWRRRAPWRALVIASGVGLALWLGAGAWLQSRQATTLPALVLQRLGAASTQPLTSAYAGRPFVVNLWATWCAPCREEMPAFAQVQRDRPEVPIVFVNQAEDEARVRGYLARLPPLEHVWLDADGALGRAIESRGLPTTVFVDARGRVARIHAGVMNRAALRAQIDALR